jgi:hypothetical protein
MEATSHLDSLLSKAEDLIETKTTLWKLKAVDKTSDTVSDVVSSLVVILFIASFILILSIGVALLIGEWLGKTYYGFFMVAGFYGIAGIIIYALRKDWIKMPVSNFIIRKILK